MKSNRLNIGIPFNYDENWIGGTYYIKNLISCLNLLPDNEQPELWILSHSLESYEFIEKETKYSRLSWLPPARLGGMDGGISRRARLLSRVTPRFLKKKLRFDLIFPYPIDSKFPRTACWIPDFQDKVLPEFFSQDELIARERQHRSYFENFGNLVFSSLAARSDFEKHYPEAKVASHVVRFAVSEPIPNPEYAFDVLKKYKLDRRFFYCPNQFWIHKNHDVVIRAVALLKKRGMDVVVAFSGKEHDHRAPGYAANLKKKVSDAGIQDNIFFLGFIPRDDQIVILQKAICIIQPSLFEGWSTVIEDAKSVSQYVLASRIPANVEQAHDNIEYFEATDEAALADLMSRYVTADPIRKHINYQLYQAEFAATFMTMAQSVAKATTQISSHIDSFNE